MIQSIKEAIMTLSRAQAVRRTQRNREDLMRRYKVKMGCARCGERHPACLDFHHPDPTTKSKSLTKNKSGKWHTGGSMWKDLGYDALVRELLSCEVLCSNCHRKAEAEKHGWRYDRPPVQEKASPARRAAEEALGLI